MAKKYNRSEILKRLRAETGCARPLLVVGAGNGLSARCAEEGGADLIVVYNSGHFRVNGLPSLVGGMPVGDANKIMMRLGRDSIRPRLRNVPVIAGVYAVDPTRDIEDVLDAVEEIGFSGVINFPGVGRHEGAYRQELEAAGYGFSREVRLVQLARERELLSLAYVYTPAEARLMAEAGVDVLVGHMGMTVGGAIGAKSSTNLQQAADRLEEIFHAACEVRKDLVLLSHGGPIATPEDAELVNRRTQAVGFVAASSFERIPIENALVNACRSFKEIAIS